MVELDDIARVQSLAWDVIEGGDLGDALETMCDAIGRVASVATLQDPVAGDINFNGHTRVDPALLEMLAERFSTPETSPQAAVLPRMRMGRLDHYSRYISKTHLERTDYYREFWLPSRVGEAGMLALRTPDGRFAFATIGCHLGREWLDEEEQLAGEMMLGSIAQAMSARTRLTQERAEAHLDAAAPDAAFLLDPEGRLRLCNRAGTELVERGVFVSLGNGWAGKGAGDTRGSSSSGARVLPQDAAAAAKFQERLGATLAGQASSPVIVKDGRRFVSILFEEGPRFRDERHILVTVRPARPMEWSVEALREHLGLTAREADVVLRLCRGASPNHIAETIGLTPETVRLNLKRAYSKTDTHSQVELVRTLLRGDLPPHEKA